MDEDDQIGNGRAISIFVGAVESANIKYNEDGSFNVDKNGNPEQKADAKLVAIVSGPVFEFDDNHTRVIENYNRVLYFFMCANVYDCTKIHANFC